MRYSIFAIWALTVAFAIANMNLFAADNELHVTIDDENNIEIEYNQQTATVTKEQLEQSLTFKYAFADVPSANVAQVIKSSFINIENKDYIMLALQQLIHIEQINNAEFEDDKQEERKVLTEQLHQYENKQLVAMMLAANYLDIKELLDAIAHVLAQNLVSEEALKKYKENKKEFLTPFHKLPTELQIKITSVLFEKYPNKIAPLYKKTRCPIIQTLSERASINCMKFNHKGTLIATASKRLLKTDILDDNAIRLWNVKTGECIKILTGHTDSVYRVLFNPNGTRILSVAEDKTARIWDVDTGENLYTFHITWYGDADFNHDGTQIATTAMDKTIRIYDASNGQCITTLTPSIQELDPPSTCFNYVQFNHDGSHIYAKRTCGKNVYVWNLNTGSKHTLTGHTSRISSMAISPKDTHIVTASWDNTVRIWNANTGECMHVLKHDDWINTARFNHDGTRVVTASKDKTARIWSVDTGYCIQTLTGHTDEVYSAQFNHTGTQVLTTGRSKTFWEQHASIVCTWDVKTGQLLHIIEEHEDAKIFAYISPNGSQLATFLKKQFYNQMFVNDHIVVIRDIQPLQNLIKFFKKDAIIENAMDALLMKNPTTEPQSWMNKIKQVEWLKIIKSDTVVFNAFLTSSLLIGSFFLYSMVKKK